LKGKLAFSWWRNIEISGSVGLNRLKATETTRLDDPSVSPCFNAYGLQDMHKKHVIDEQLLLGGGALRPTFDLRQTLQGN
jgi:hypothetical protein